MKRALKLITIILMTIITIAKRAPTMAIVIRDKKSTSKGDGKRAKEMTIITMMIH